jgi:eukaryotic-like serine/threonine-protein kinase
LSDDAVTLLELHALTPGSIVGSWLLLQRVDSGTYGIVFLAQRAGHPDSPPVALKLAKQVGDPRFEREGQVLKLVHHPNLPRYEDSGLWTSPNGRRYPYVVMEFIEGFTLYEWFRKQPRSSREVMRVLAQVARGLAEVHAKGAVHRDVKGDNIRVTPHARAVLLDFGSTWLHAARPLTDPAAPPGTTVYRPPEMRRFMHKFRMETKARWVAHSSDDLYSLGVTAYRLIAGTYLSTSTDTGDTEPHKMTRLSELTPIAVELEGTILRLLSEDRQARGTAAQIAKALERAAKEARPAADTPILLTPAAAPTEKWTPEFSSDSSSSSKPSRSRSSTAPKRRPHGTSLPIWLSWASAAMVGGTLVAIAVDVRGKHPPEPELQSVHEERHLPHRETPDAGVGDEVLLSTQDVPRAAAPTYGLGRSMPDQPFPNQRKPPCDPDSERVINGGCWFGPSGTLKPPCGRSAFEHEDGCYVPMFDPPRQPTSDPP